MATLAYPASSESISGPALCRILGLGRRDQFVHWCRPGCWRSRASPACPCDIPLAHSPRSRRRERLRRRSSHAPKLDHQRSGSSTRDLLGPCPHLASKINDLGPARVVHLGRIAGPLHRRSRNWSHPTAHRHWRRFWSFITSCKVSFTSSAEGSLLHAERPAPASADGKNHQSGLHGASPQRARLLTPAARPGGKRSNGPHPWRPNYRTRRTQNQGRRSEGGDHPRAAAIHAQPSAERYEAKSRAASGGVIVGTQGFHPAWRW